MIEINKSIWDAQFDDCFRVIPTNMNVKDNGCLVMGRGLAKQAAERYPRLPQYLGMEAMNGRNFVLIEPEKLIAFPTKYHWRESSVLGLIESGLKSLVDRASMQGYSEKIVSPRLGCGLGNLDWNSEVKPLMLKYFGDDDNFIIASL